MDVEKLRIERPAARPRARGGIGQALGWSVVALVVAGAATVFWEPAARAIDSLRLPRVEVHQVTRTSALAASAVGGTAANGYVVARRRAALSADTPGRIVEMNVEEGAVVEEGSVVARLYADEYEAALRQAEADLEAARAAHRRALAEVDAARALLDELKREEEAGQAALDEAGATQRLADAHAARMKGLADENIVSEEEWDAAVSEKEQAAARVAVAEATWREAQASSATGRSNVAVAEARAAEAAARIETLAAARDLAKATLEKTVVRAPFAGVIVLKDAEVGEVVSPNAAGSQSRGSVATLADFASLEVQVEVPETSLSAVAVGSAADIYLDAFPERRYTGRVTRIWPTANRQKATIEVRVAFDETDELLRPEMGARVVFGDSPPDGAAPAEDPPPAGAILIPSGALVRLEDRTGVFVVERGVARFRELSLGQGRADRVLVEAGLQPGESIVADPPHSLSDGDRIHL